MRLPSDINIYDRVSQWSFVCFFNDYKIQNTTWYDVYLIENKKTTLWPQCNCDLLSTWQTYLPRRFRPIQNQTNTRTLRCRLNELRVASSVPTSEKVNNAFQTVASHNDNSMEVMESCQIEIFQHFPSIFVEKLTSLFHLIVHYNEKKWWKLWNSARVM